MRKYKREKRKSGNKKSASQKTAGPKQHPIQHGKPPHFKRKGGSPSVQIHQGVGFGTASQSEFAPEIADDAAEYGQES
jgi:hypothetical protein